MKTTQDNRRQFLQLGLAATAGILTTGIACNSAIAETNSLFTNPDCTPTPTQDIGPFYPHVKNGDGDVDLTRIIGKPGHAEGEVILIRGIVRDEQCQPLPGALVEIWQANRHGRYAHECDDNLGIPLDPCFEGWGEMATTKGGTYGFRTIKPGAYALGGDEWRTPHIHFRVSCKGYREICTQMYFDGENLNETDGVLAELLEEEQEQLIVKAGMEGDLPIYRFDLSLQKVKTLAEREAALESFVGSYDLVAHGEEPKLLVFRRGGHQLFLDREGHASVQLKPAGQDAFLAKPIQCRYEFQRTKDGSIKNVKLTTTSSRQEVQVWEATKL